MRVATYTRISTDEETQPYSLEAQDQRLGAYIKSQDGWELARRFSDQMTGSTLDRPQLQSALAEARAKRFELLLVYRVDRLSRSVRGLAQILEDLDHAGVVFRSATEPFDTSTPAGRMMVQMLGVFAEFERATLIDRVIAGMERKAARGQWCGGTPPYGYRMDPSTGFLVVEPSQAALVPVIFDLYTNKRIGAQAIALWLNERGHRTRSGRLWNTMRVLTVLRNRAYLGEVFYRGTYHPAPHPPLLDADAFAAAQAILQQRGENHSLRASNPSEYLLTGRVRCESCGKHYVGSAAHGTGGRYEYYVCYSRQRFGSNVCSADRLPAGKLDAAVVDSLMAALADERLLADALLELKERRASAGASSRAELQTVERQISKHEEAIERYFSAFEAGRLEPDLCNQRIDSLTQKIGLLRARRAELAGDAPDRSPAPTLQDVSRLAVEARTVLDVGPAEERKALLQALVQEVRVRDRRTIQPFFRLPARLPATAAVPRPTGGAGRAQRPVRIVSRLVAPGGLEPPLAV